MERIVGAIIRIITHGASHGISNDNTRNNDNIIRDTFQTHDGNEAFSLLIDDDNSVDCFLGKCYGVMG